MSSNATFSSVDAQNGSADEARSCYGASSGQTISPSYYHTDDGQYNNAMNHSHSDTARDPSSQYTGNDQPSSYSTQKESLARLRRSRQYEPPSSYSASVRASGNYPSQSGWFTPATTWYSPGSTSYPAEIALEEEQVSAASPHNSTSGYQTPGTQRTPKPRPDSTTNTHHTQRHHTRARHNHYASQSGVAANMRESPTTQHYVQDYTPEERMRLGLPRFESRQQEDQYYQYYGSDYTRR